MTTKTKSTRCNLREAVERDLAMLNDGKKTNISSPGYRLVQAICDRLDGKASANTESLKEPTVARNGMGDHELISILTHATAQANLRFMQKHTR